MAKYLVDTFYTCTLKVTHFLDNISEKELENLEKREDGKFEILDIKIDKRKTKNLEKNLMMQKLHMNTGLSMTWLRVQ